MKDLSFTVPRADNPRIEYLQNNRSHLTITWIGHSTFLIQMNGCNIITDPVWAGRMGIEKRLAPPGLEPKQLPPIDIVVISHNHYDHLHFRSLRQLPGNPLYLIPEGLYPLFARRGLRQAEEMSWWQQKEYNNISVTFLPAQHWSRRGIWDINASHWGGFLFAPASSSSSPSVYFAGDSGYFSGFREIGGKFQIDYALLPIGAYEPEWFMSMQHMTPEEAVQAFADLKARHFIPMHYGSFRLADDTPREALDRLLAEWEKRKLPNEQLILLKHGETLSKENV